MPRLTIHLFGPVEAVWADTSLHFATDKVRALLAYLAVEQGRPHRRERLAALLWPDQPDSKARRNLRLTLHRLKQSLDKAAPDLSDQLLTASRTAVQWEENVARIDYTRFIHLLTETEKHDHPRLETCPECLDRLETAVPLLRGEMLTGLSLPDAAPFDEWLLVQREFIHHRALRLYAALADAYERRGDYPRVLTYAQKQIALEPWYEAAHRQVMRALALGGDRERALAQYETCRAILWEELGVEPAPETAVLHQQIRNDALRSQPAPLPLHHLPADLTPFVGRDRELAHITDALSDSACRLLTLLGPGGIGKTRLALQAAQRIAAAPADAACEAITFIPLAAAETSATAVTLLAEKCGVTLSGAADPLQEVAQHLRPQRRLLILDNVEQLPDAADLVAALLQEAPQIQLLVTSRLPLRLRAERRLPLGGLPYPAVADAAIADLPASPAVALFVQSARQMVPDFRLDAAAATAVVQLCRLVDGHPLALELAAGWTRLLDPAAILHETEQNLAFLATDMGQTPERHRSLHAVFNQTWGMLSPALQQILAQTAVFPGDFTLAALQAILPRTTMLDIAALLDKSLLRRNDDNRYTLHPLLKQFAAAHAPPVAGWQAAFCRHYLADVAAQETALFGPAPQTALRHIRRDLGNVRQAWLWAAERGLWPEMSAALPALSRFYQMEGLFAEAVTGAAHTLPKLKEGGETAVLRRQLHLQASYFLGQQGAYDDAIQQAEAALAADPVAAAQAHAHIGEWRRHQGRYEEAEAALTTAVALFDHTPSPHLAAAHNEIGFTHLGRGQYPAARAAFQTALTLYEELGDRSGTAVTLGNLGYAAQLQSDYENAHEYLERALRMAQEIGDRQSIVKHTLGLGWIALQQGEMVEAQARQQAALRQASDIGYLRGVLTARRHIADAALYQNKLDEAETGYRSLLTQAERARLPDLVAHATGNLGIVHARRGAYDDAIRQYEAAITLCRELGDPISLRKHLTNLGSVYRRLGDYEAARACFTETLQLEQTAGLRHGEANSLMNLGAVYRGQGDYRLAQVYFERSLALQETLGHKDGIGKSLGFLGMLHLQQGTFESAIERFQAALALSEGMGDRLTAAVWRLNLGEVYGEMEVWDTAVASLEEALATFRAVGSKQYMSAALIQLARVHLRRGDAAAAQLAAAEGLNLATAVGEKEALFKGQMVLAQIAAARGEEETAVGQMQTLLEAEPDPTRQALLHYELWRLTDDAAHAQTAHVLHRQLTQQTPHHQYQKRIDELAEFLQI